MNKGLPHRWANKPPLGSTIDFSHPMATGLVFYTLLNEGSAALVANKLSATDLVTNKPGTFGRGSYVLDAPGLAAQGEYIGGSAGPFATWASNFSIVAYPFTMFIYVSQTASTNSFTPIFCINTSGGGGFHAIDFNSGTYQAKNQGGSFAGSFPMTLGKYYLLTMAYDTPSSWRMYMDGILKTTLTATSYAVPTLTQVILGSFGAANNVHFNAVYAGIYNRALSTGEIVSLGQDPYQFINPPTYKRLFYMPPSAFYRTPSVPVIMKKPHWQIKPPVGSQIDQSHPLAQGLVFYSLLNEGGGTKNLDMASNQLMTVKGNPWSIGPYGPQMTQNGTNLEVSRLTSCAVSGYPVTMFFYGAALAGSNGTVRSSIGIFDNAATNFIEVGWNSTTGALYTQTGGTGGVFATIGVGVWAHVVVVWASATDRKYYVNGTQVNFSTSSIAFPSGINNTCIGGFNINSPSFHMICYAGMYNRALTAGEVAALYQDPYQFIQAPAQRRAIVIPPPSPTLLKVGYPKTVSRWGLTKPPLGSVIDKSHPMAAGLVFYTLLNEAVPTGRAYATNLVDNKGVSGNATAPAFVVDTPGIVFSQDFASGTSPLLWLYNNTSINIQNYPFTLFAYAACTGDNSTLRQFLMLYNVSANAFYNLTFGNFTWIVYNQGGTLTGFYPLTARQYYLFTACFDSPTSWRWYMDTTLKSTQASTSYAMQSLGAVRVGTFSGPQSHMNIAYAGIYNRALTLADIASLRSDPYQFIQAPSQRRLVAMPPTPQLPVSVPKKIYHWMNKPPVGSEIDWSNPIANGLVYYMLFNEGGGQRHLDLVSRQFATIGTAVWGLGPYGPMLSMNNIGSASGASILSSSAIQGYPCTFFCLAMILPGNNGTARYLVGVWNNSLNPIVGLAVGGTTGVISLVFNGGTGNTPLGTIGISTWAHVVLVCDSATSRRLYINGTLNGTSSTTAAFPVGTYNRTATGGFNSSSASFMSVAYAGIYNRSLSADDVADLYQDPYQFLQPPSYRRMLPVSPTRPAIPSLIVPSGKVLPRQLFEQKAN